MAEQSAAGPPGGSQAQAGTPPVDVRKLAERVYQLLMADARLSRSRGDVPLPAARTGEG